MLYVAKNGIHADKVMKSSCNCKRLNCSSKILKETRQTLFTAYWQLADIDKQRQSLVNRVTNAVKNRSRGSSVLQQLIERHLIETTFDRTTLDQNDT